MLNISHINSLVFIAQNIFGDLDYIQFGFDAEAKSAPLELTFKWSTVELENVG